MDRDRRARELAAFAAGHGLFFEEAAGADLLDARFSLSSLFTGDVLGLGTNLIWGDWNGLQIKGLDYTASSGELIAPRPARAWFPLRAGFSVVMVNIQASFPYICIQKKDWLKRLGDDLDRIVHLHHDKLEIMTGIHPFDRHFETRGRHHDFAYDLLDESMAASLLRTVPEFAVEAYGDAFIVYHPLLPRGELPLLLDAAKAFYDHIPGQVWSDYGSADLSAR